MIDKFVKNTSREISIDYIQKVVCDYFNIPIEMIHSKTRKREIVQARQLSMYFSKKHTKASLASIGLHCGNKDHATVLHACRTVNNLVETDKQFRSLLKNWTNESNYKSLATTCMKILFVCTGNICRSPLAEGILKEKLRMNMNPGRR